MAYTSLPRISRSKSKADLYKNLRWVEGDERYDRLYKQMMEEANVGRDNICRNPLNLVQAKQGTPGPYSASDVTETAMYREVLAIWDRASITTRGWYGYGRIQEGTTVDNWIIRWTLWHAFRYRDSRNQPVADHGRRTRSSSSEAANPTIVPRATSKQTVVYYVNGSYYDPVRDC